jgi:hypothetical protein
MVGLVPAIHGLQQRKAWMPDTRPHEAGHDRVREIRPHFVLCGTGAMARSEAVVGVTETRAAEPNVCGSR